MENSRKRIFITGAAGFIGFHLAKKLHQRKDFVVGCDNYNSYYDPELKKYRTQLLKEKNIFVFSFDLSDQASIEKIIKENQITHLVHLAAQAGVRYSLSHPEKYQETNSNGFFHLLEVLRRFPQIKCTFASSSSVYGLNKKTPFSESDRTDFPANFYGATKKSNELMAHAYHHLYGIAMTGLRYFTVYGPYGRPDMAYYSFTKAIQEEKPISLFNEGNMQRDFTYIDDIIDGTLSAIDRESSFEIFNLGNNHPEEIKKMIGIIENFLEKKAILKMLPMQPGEIPITYADTSKAEQKLRFKPKTPLEEGMEKFLQWFEIYHQIPMKK